MILATTQAEDFDRFLNIFSTKGAEKRKQHGPRVRTSFAIPMRPTVSGFFSTGMPRVGRASSRKPEVPPIMQEAGHKGRPQTAELGGQYDAWRVPPCNLNDSASTDYAGG